MRNYRILSVADRNSLFGSKTFTEEQAEKLRNLKFGFKDFPRQWYKHYCYNPPYGSVEMILFLAEQHMRFLNGSYPLFLPCELEKMIGPHYKKLMKLMVEDIKRLKEIGVISQ